MTSTITNLEIEMREELRLVHSGSDHLTTAVKAARLIKDYIRRLRDHIRDNSFTSRKEELDYFKYWAPRFYGRLLYYHKIIGIATERLHVGTVAFETYLKKQLAGLEDFYYLHEDFCKRFYLRDNILDDRIFVCNPAENQMLDEIEIVMASDFCLGSYYASKLYANLRLRRYLEHQLNLRPPPDAPRLTFEADKIFAGEIIFLLYTSKCFGNKKLNEIAEWFQVHANTGTLHIHLLWQEMKRKKTSITKNIDQGVAAIRKKADDEN